MDLALYRREHLQSGNAQMVGDATADQFQRTHAAIGAWSDVEHTDDGHHGSITAESLDVAGDATIGGDLAVAGDGAIGGEASIGGDLAVGGNGALVGDLTVGGDASVDGTVSAADGHVAIGDLPPVAPSGGGYGLYLDPWQILAHSSALRVQYLSEALSGFLVQIARTAAYTWELYAAPGIALSLGVVGSRLSAVWTGTVDAVYYATVGQWRVLNLTTAPGSAGAPALAVQWLLEGSGPQVCLFRYSAGDYILAPVPGIALRLGGAGYPVETVEANALYTSLGVIERRRPVAMGEWQDVPYSPGLFSTQGGAAWTVPAGATYYYRYALVGKTVHVQFIFTSCSVGAGALYVLQVQAPAGVTFAAGAAGKPLALVPYAVSAGVNVVPQVTLQVVDPARWGLVIGATWAAATGSTDLYGSFTVEIA